MIGLSGYARAGKNTVADLLPEGYRQVSFAEPMREAMLRLNPTIYQNDYQEVDNDGVMRLSDAINELGWQGAKEKLPEVRRLLQVFGTEVGRNMFGENFWVEQAFKDVHVGDNVVFTDVRFPNEAQAIIEHGGEVWRINRPGVIAHNAHASETSLDDWKFHRVIENDGTIEQLREKIYG